MNTVMVDTQLIKEIPNLLYVTVEMEGDVPVEVMLWRNEDAAFAYRTGISRKRIQVFCCMIQGIQEGASNENVSDVEIVLRGLTAEELDQKFKDADTCSREEVK